MSKEKTTFGSINGELQNYPVEEYVEDTTSSNINEEEKNSPIIEFLRTPTGEGSIESHLEHPLNFNKSMAVARIIRGLSGFLGNLNLALVDIFIGVIELISEKNKKEEDLEDPEPEFKEFKEEV